MGKKVNTNKEGFKFETLVGKKAAFTTYEGERLVGKIELRSSRFHTEIIVRFENGMWGALGSEVELVN
jgi:hypothetical protein